MIRFYDFTIFVLDCFHIIFVKFFILANKEDIIKIIFIIPLKLEQ